MDTRLCGGVVQEKAGILEASSERLQRGLVESAIAGPKALLLQGRRCDVDVSLEARIGIVAEYLSSSS